jgi:dTDP-4-amino-4,6-dideoxygalactose transaminase
MGIFSFTPSKPMTTGEGGMIVTDNDEFAQRARLIMNFGDTFKFKWDYLGFNFRMPEVMGAIGLEQLKKLATAVSLRKKIAERYNNAFMGEETIILTNVRRPEDINYQLYTVRINTQMLKIDRDEIINLLADREIGSRLYYPALHNQKVFSSFTQYSESSYMNCEEFTKTALSLPIYPTLKKEEQDYVIDSLLDIIELNKN